jgi:hypothetical protein
MRFCGQAGDGLNSQRATTRASSRRRVASTTASSSAVRACRVRCRSADAAITAGAASAVRAACSSSRRSLEPAKISIAASSPTTTPITTAATA